MPSLMSERKTIMSKSAKNSYNDPRPNPLPGQGEGTLGKLNGPVDAAPGIPVDWTNSMAA
jgi:hypothetical protein